jgi:hypothetical protein
VVTSGVTGRCVGGGGVTWLWVDHKANFMRITRSGVDFYAEKEPLRVYQSELARELGVPEKTLNLAALSVALGGLPPLVLGVLAGAGAMALLAVGTVGRRSLSQPLQVAALVAAGTLGAASAVLAPAGLGVIAAAASFRFREPLFDGIVFCLTAPCMLCIGGCFFIAYSL